MAIELTREQFIELMDNIAVDENGNTNKKCPICGNDVISEDFGSAYTLKCKTRDCVSLDFRGL